MFELHNRQRTKICLHQKILNVCCCLAGISYLFFPGHMTDMYGSLVQVSQQNDRSSVSTFSMGTYRQVLGPVLKVLQQQIGKSNNEPR